ncbi:MAG: hypothetical protein U0R24_15705 [Solirubrobacterales bacterium]
MDELASLPQAGKPLYLRVVLDELRRVSAHEPLDARIAELAEAASIPALLGMVLERYEATFDGRGADSSDARDELHLGFTSGTRGR